MNEIADYDNKRPAQWNIRGLLLLVAAFALVLTPISLMIRFSEGHPVSMRDLSRVELGMTESEVDEILGTPDHTSGQHGRLIWTYQAFTWCVVRINFDQGGRVVEIDHDH